MSENIYQDLVNFVRSLLPPHRDAAVQFFADPEGTLAAQGFADTDLSGYDLSQVVSDACNDPSVPQSTRDAVQGYTSTSHPARSVEHTVQQLQQVTTVVYEGDEYFVDNRTTIDVEHLEGDIDIDNITAQGAGAAAAGGDINQASGNSQIIDGDNFGDANNAGDRGVVVDVDSGFPVRGPLAEEQPLLIRTEGGLGGLLGGGGGLNINTGDGFAGVQGTGPVVNPVVGDGNQVANVQAPLTNSNLNFGDGNNNLAGSTQVDSPTAFGGGDAVNQVGNVVGPGGALAGSGGASGYSVDDHSLTTYVEDNDTTTTTTSTNVETTVTTDASQHNIDADRSTVTSEDHSGDQFFADPVHVPAEPQSEELDPS